jgi:hypothetical protein
LIHDIQGHPVYLLGTSIGMRVDFFYNFRAISTLTKLKELRLCYTKLQSIGPGALGGLESLTTLHVCNNRRLTEIDEDFLTWFDDDDEMKTWPPVKEVKLDWAI